MRQFLVVLGFICFMLGGTPALFSQKEAFGGSASPGKSEMKGDEDPKSFGRPASEPAPQATYSTPSRSESTTSHEAPAVDDSRSTGYTPPSYESQPASQPAIESHSSPSTHANAVPMPDRPAPAVIYQAAPPIPRSLGKPEDDEDNPVAPKPRPRATEAAPQPRPNFARPTFSSGHPESLQPAETASTNESPGRPALPAKASPRTEPGNGPLPTPPGGWGTVGQSGTGETIDLPASDTLRGVHFAGNVLSAPPKPQFSRDTLPHFPTEAAPKPKVPVTTAEPQVQPIYIYNYSSGDPYAIYTNLESFFFSSASYNVNVWSGPSELGCIYQNARGLEQLYLAPAWCGEAFTQEYDAMLAEMRLCLRNLPDLATEPWMWPAYYTYEDERNFWAEECVTGNKQLMAVRDFLRAKAVTVPYLMPMVDERNPEDWAYVDTSFAAPFGGYNYYRTMNAYSPDLVVKQLQQWLGQFPIISRWPSYARIADFHDHFYESGFRSLIDKKIDQDLDAASIAIVAGDPKAFQLAENAGWLCAAVLAVDHKHKPAVEQAGRAARLLEMTDSNRWAKHPLAKVLEAEMD